MNYSKYNVLLTYGYAPTYPTNFTSNGVTHTLTWTKGKLTTYKKSTSLAGTSTYTYAYDAYGRRISKSYKFIKGSQALVSYVTRSSTVYTYDTSGRLVRESLLETYNDLTSVNRNILYLYDESGIVGSVQTYNTTTETFYFDRNIKGDVIGIYNASGTQIAKYSYDSWGNSKLTTLSSNNFSGYNPIRYRGYYFDAESGFYFLNARYYNPAWRRFISPDDTAYLDPDTPSGLNLYAYCNNDPVNYCDPSGNIPEWLGWLMSGAAIIGGLALCATGVGGILGGILIGAGAGSLINGYIAKSNGEDFTAGYVGGVISGTLCALGAGLGGWAFAAASTAVNFACIGYFTLGVTCSFVGGFLGNFVGTIYINWHNSGFNGVNIDDWQELLITSCIIGSLNIFAGLGSSMSKVAGDIAKATINANQKLATRILAGTIAGATEYLYGLVSYLISIIV